MRHGSEDYALRVLSTGRYIGIVPTRNIADSVFVSMLLKELRDPRGSPHIESSTLITSPTSSSSAFSSASFKPRVTPGNKSKAQASAIRYHQYWPIFPSPYTRSIGNTPSSTTSHNLLQLTAHTSFFGTCTTDWALPLPHHFVIRHSRH